LNSSPQKSAAMKACWILACCLAVVEAGTPEPWPSNLPELECALHQLAFEYGSAKVSTNAASLYAALRLQNCSQLLSTIQRERNAKIIRDMDCKQVKKLESILQQDDARTLYVATTGSDTDGDGTLKNPFASLKRAQNSSRKLSPSAASPVTVIVRAGKYYMSETLVLDSRDSYTSFTAHAKEHVTLSGGYKLSGLQWKSYEGGPIQMAKITLPPTPSPPPFPTPAPPPTPPPTPKPAVNKTCGFELATDFAGHDVQTNLTASSPDACCALCKAHPTCKAFTTYTHGGACWLKSSDAGRTQYADHVSGRPGEPTAPSAVDDLDLY
jgi:hypothetical protein